MTTNTLGSTPATWQAVYRGLFKDALDHGDVDALRDAITEDVESGLRPVMVHVAAGSTSTGAMDDIAAVGEVASFRRRGDDDLFCAFNLGDTVAEIGLPEGTWTTIGTDLGSQTARGGRVTLGPWGICLAKRA